MLDCTMHGTCMQHDATNQQHKSRLHVTRVRHACSTRATHMQQAHNRRATGIQNLHFGSLKAKQHFAVGKSPSCRTAWPTTFAVRVGINIAMRPKGMAMKSCSQKNNAQFRGSNPTSSRTNIVRPKLMKTHFCRFRRFDGRSDCHIGHTVCIDMCVHMRTDTP